MPKRRNAAAKRNPAASRSMKARTTRGRRPSEQQIRNRRDRDTTRYYEGTDARTVRDQDYSAYYRAEGASHRGDLQAARRNTAKVPGYGNQSQISPHSHRGEYDSSPGFRKKQRAADTLSALQRADASMFNYDD